MREEVLDLRLVGHTDIFTTSGMISRFSDGRTFMELEERLKKYGWSSVIGLPDIPNPAVFELPEKYKQKHDYFLLAGNRRILVAKNIISHAPFYIYDRDEEPTKEILGVFCRNGRSGSLYDLILDDYLCVRHFL